MRTLVTLLGVALAILSLLAASAVANASLGLLVIVHPGTHTGALSAYEVEAVFSRSQTRWSDGTPIVPLNAPPGTDLRVEFDRAVLRLSPDQVGRFWVDRRVRGLGMPPKQVSDPSLTLRIVQNLRGAIGYVPASVAIGDQVNLVARVQQGKVLPP